MSEHEVVENFAKKQKETYTMAKEHDVKSNTEMAEGKNEISVRYIRVVADWARLINTVSYLPMNHSRFNIISEKFI